jgi:hypothetical protein
MKSKLILIGCLLASTTCLAQKEYKASNGITYHVGDSVKIGKGSGVNDQYLYLMRWGFMAAMSYNQNKDANQFNLFRGYNNMSILIKKIKTGKFAGQDKTYFILDAPHLTALLYIEDAINSCEVIPCTDKNKPQLSIADELTKLKSLLDSGAITQSEYDAQKKKLLNN